MIHISGHNLHFFARDLNLLGIVQFLDDKIPNTVDSCFIIQYLATNVFLLVCAKYRNIYAL